MTVDIRAAAGAEAEVRYVVGKDDHALALAFAELRREGFAEGAVWAQAQLTPTREQIAEAFWSATPLGNVFTWEAMPEGDKEIWLNAADAVRNLPRQQ